MRSTAFVTLLVIGNLAAAPSWAQTDHPGGSIGGIGGPQGNGPQGNGPQGNGPQGNAPQGNGPQGNGPQGGGAFGSGGGSNGPPGGNGDKPSNGSGSSGQVSGKISGKSVTVTIGGETFSVSPTASANLLGFLNEYQQYKDVSSLVGAMATLFSILGLVSIDAQAPLHDAVLKISAGTGDDIAVQLAVLGTLNEALRAKAVNECLRQMAAAAMKPGGTQEAKMWRSMRDVIANPERYKNGGIKFDKNGGVQLRALPVQKFNATPGAKLNNSDIVALGMLTNSLLQKGAAADYLSQADYFLTMKTTDDEFPLTLRDEYYLNIALFALPSADKAAARNFIVARQWAPGTSLQFWKMLEKFTVDGDAYSERTGGMSVDSWTDPLGFEDDYPNNSDLVAKISING